MGTSYMIHYNYHILWHIKITINEVLLGVEMDLLYKASAGARNTIESEPSYVFTPALTSLSRP